MNQHDGQRDTQGRAPFEAILQMITGKFVTQAVYVAAKLGVADLLKGGPRSVGELAAATGTHAPSLYRVLRALASLGVFTESDAGHFALTPLGEVLRSDAPGSARAFAIMVGEPWHWRPWGEILHSVRTGAPAFDHVYGEGIFDYFAHHEADSEVFNDAMTKNSESLNQAITAGYDFSSFERVADIAGGHGSLLAAILKANPQVRGLLFDAPHVVEGARPHLAAAGVAGRCELAAGDFFSSVPAGADAYLMKFIIHDWDDERALVILKNCHRAMAEDGKLLLVEGVVPEGDEPHLSKLLDLEMLVLPGGRERTAREFAALLDRAGFRMTRVVATGTPLSVIEAVRK